MCFTDCFSSDIEPAPSLIEWTESFYEMPVNLFKTLMNNCPDDWEEITEIQEGSTISVMTMDDFNKLGIVEDITVDEEGPCYNIQLNEDSRILTLRGDELELYHEDMFPTGLKVYSFVSEADNLWLRKTGAHELSKLGLRVFRSRRFGYFFSSDNIVGDSNIFMSIWGELYKIRFNLKEV